MVSYEKKSYFMLYSNYLEMKKHFGDKAMLPAFMKRYLPPSHPTSRKRASDGSKSRKSSSQAETASCEKISCEKCKMTFRSERQYKSHDRTCLPPNLPSHGNTSPLDMSQRGSCQINNGQMSQSSFIVTGDSQSQLLSVGHQVSNLLFSENTAETHDVMGTGGQLSGTNTTLAQWQIRHPSTHSEKENFLPLQQAFSTRVPHQSSAMQQQPQASSSQSQFQWPLVYAPHSSDGADSAMQQQPQASSSQSQYQWPLVYAPHSSDEAQNQFMVVGGSLCGSSIVPQQSNAMQQASGSQSEPRSSFSQLRPPLCTVTSQSAYQQVPQRAPLQTLQSQQSNTMQQDSGSLSEPRSSFSQLRQPSCTVTSQSAYQQVPQRAPLQTLQSGTVQTREPPLPAVSDPDYSFFLNSSIRVNRLIREGLESVKKYKYDVRKIIETCRDGVSLVGKLDRQELVYGPERGKIVHALFNHLLVSSGNVVSAISTSTRSAMAILFIATWPKMKKPLMTAEDRPWHHWYKTEENTGFLANVVISNQRSLKRTSGKGIRNKDGPTVKKPRRLLPIQDLEEVDPDDPEEYAEYLKNVYEASETVPLPGERLNILHLMEITFERRREIFKNKQVSCSIILTKFNHFTSYGGAVILQEFAMLHPGKQNLFLRQFPSDMMPKLLKIGKGNAEKYKLCYPVKMDELNSLLILAKFLPTPQRRYEHEKEMPLQAKLVDLFHIVPRGTDPQVEARSKMESVEYPIQPYILAQGDINGVFEMYLVLENTKLLRLAVSSVAAAIDILIKSYFALCLHFPLGWKNVLTFLHVHVFKIPLENAKGRRSIFDEKNMIILNVELP